MVTEVEHSRTFRLRQQVLRPHQSLEQMSLFDDGEPDTGIFAAIEPESGEVVGTANVRRAPPPEALEKALPEGTGLGQSWRLRGMATREDLRGQGIGLRVLEACIDHVARRGGGILWCNARLGARVFYGRAGFFEVGEEFDEVGIGLHVVMWRLVEPTAPGRTTAQDAPRGQAR